MKAELTIDQIEQDVESIRAQNQKILQELQDVKNENFQLREKLQQDRDWLAEKLEIISQSQVHGDLGFPQRCSCGLAAILEQAKKRASAGLSSIRPN